MFTRSDVSPEEGARELLFRRAARENLIDFTKYTKKNYYNYPFNYNIVERSCICT